MNKQAVFEQIREEAFKDEMEKVALRFGTILRAISDRTGKSIIPNPSNLSPKQVLSYAREASKTIAPKTKHHEIIRKTISRIQKDYPTRSKWQSFLKNQGFEF
jgi:hypothetical protein